MKVASQTCPLGSSFNTNHQVRQYAMCYRGLVFIGAASILSATVLSADAFGAVLTPRTALGLHQSNMFAPPEGMVSHGTHAIGQASSQQRSTYSKVHSSVIGAACPPQWLPMLLAFVSQPQSPQPTPPHYKFAHGTFQSPPIGSGSALGCTDLDDLLGDQPRLAEAIDVCFDAKFACSHAQPFVGTAMILGFSEGSPQTGEQAVIQLEGSDSWLPALVPVHVPRGSRRTTKQPVPVVGCLINNGSRFVLSWADIRCRSSTAAPFPAECDGASHRNVAIEDVAAAISFVESRTQESRRKLQNFDGDMEEKDLGDSGRSPDHAKGKKTAMMLIMSPKDATSPANAWNGDATTGYTLDAMFSSSPTECAKRAVHERPQPLSCAAGGPSLDPLRSPLPRPPPLPHQHVSFMPARCLSDDGSQRGNESLVVGQARV